MVMQGYRITGLRSIAALTSLSITLAGCSFFYNSCASKVDERVEYWRQIIAKEIPVGSPRQDVVKWADSRSMHLVSGGPAGDKHEYWLIVEKIECSSLSMCSEMDVNLSIDFGPDDKSIKQDLFRTGVCA